MEDRPLRVGDRVEWTGPSEGPVGGGPQHGERGWLIMVDPADDIIMFDVCGHQSANYIHSPGFGSLRLVDELVGFDGLLGYGPDSVLEDLAFPASHVREG